jgi:hypothetical protein
VRVRDADDFTFVLEDEHVRNIPMRAELHVLGSPDAKEHLDPAVIQFRERQIMARRVTDDAREAARVAAAIDRRARRQRRRCIRRYARQVVLEDKCLSICGIALPVDAAIAGTEIAVLDVGRQRRLPGTDLLAFPGTVLPMRRDDDPLFTKRMPALFPLDRCTSPTPNS